MSTISDLEREVQRATERVQHTRSRRNHLRADIKRQGVRLGELRSSVTEARQEREENREKLVVIRDRLQTLKEDGIEASEQERFDKLMNRHSSNVGENEELTDLIRRLLPKIHDLAEKREDKDELREHFGNELEEAIKWRERVERELKDARRDANRNPLGSPYFVASEFDCHAGGPVPTYMHDDLADLCDRVLDKMRVRFGPAHVNSGHRWVWYNAQIGGASASFHCYEVRQDAPAADMTFANGSPSQWAAFARSLGVGGVGQYGTFCHVDTGPRRDWWG